MQVTKIFRIIFFLFCVVSFFSACKKAPPPEAQTQFVLGTVCSVNLYEQGTQDVYQAIFTRLRDLEEYLSANKAGTDVDRINQKDRKSVV
jgi:thiamine biosynthesis lipoprotein